MEQRGLFYYLILNAPLLCFYAHATFTEVPQDMSVCEGEDIEMPCAFRAVGAAPFSLEIQWWYLKEAAPREPAQELQLSSSNRANKVAPKDATKISTVRVQGSAISHKLSLSGVRKEDEGVYECRVSDLYSDETQEYKVQATLRVTPRDGMLAEEAVSHMRNINAAAAGSAVSGGGGGGGGGGRSTPEPVQDKAPRPPVAVPASTSPAATVVRSSAAPRPGNAAILRQQHGAGCGVMVTTQPLLYITLMMLHKLLPFLTNH